MTILDMSYHIALLIESHLATVDWASKWLVVCVDALMGEEFVKATEDFHAGVLFFTFRIDFGPKIVRWNIRQLSI